MYLKVLRKNLIVVYQNNKELEPNNQENQPVISQKTKKRALTHQLLNCEPSISGSKISGDNIRIERSLAAINEPEWFHIINPIFSETNAKLKVATKADDLMSSENEGSDGDTADELSDERVNESITPSRSHQRSPLQFKSSTSCDGATSGSPLSNSSEEEDGIDLTDTR